MNKLKSTIGLAAACALLALSTGCQLLRNPQNIQVLARDTTILGADAALINNLQVKPKLMEFYTRLTDYIAKGNITINGLNALATDVGVKFLQSTTAQYAQQDVLAAATGIQQGLAVALGL